MPTQSQLLQQFAQLAVPIARARHYPPELLLAQWAIESGWGERTSGDNNYFGMTRAKRHGDNWKWVATREVLKDVSSLDADEMTKVTSRQQLPDGKWDVRLSRRFASYPTVEAGVIDKIELIQNGAPYKPLFDRYKVDGDLAKLVDAFAPIYATDPGYAKLVKQIMGQENIRRAVWDSGAV
jgi:flagellum-specific peptidoglycan hydrolase FlgJ